MPKRGKKYSESRKQLNTDSATSFVDAVKKTLESSYVKFDEMIDVAVRLGVDPRHADQMVRGSVVLPNGLGREVKVLVFTKGEKDKEALDAGADFVGNDDLIEKIKGGWFRFDKAVATPDMMGEVGKLGRVLGPRGLMPNPKSGTVTFEVAKAVGDLKKGKIEFRVDKGANVHVPVGKASFEKEQLVDNIRVFLKELIGARPPAAKGQFVRSLTLSTSMGPGVRIDFADASVGLK